MTRSSATILQLFLPFEGVQDRIRLAAEAGRVCFMPSAQADMSRLDISDILIVRSLLACAVSGKARPGASRGEWTCAIVFSAKGFRRGGVIDATLSDGRVFVKAIRWDQTDD